MSAVVNGGGAVINGSSGGIAALSEILGGETEGDFVVSDGAGGVQLASEAPAAVRAIIGAGVAATQPTSLAAYAQAEAQRRRGPLAMRTTGAGIGTTAPTTTSTQPSIMTNTSGVLTFYQPIAGGAITGVAFGQNGSWGVRGWYISIGVVGVQILRIGLMLPVVQTIDFPNVVTTVGWHSLAWSIPADGLSVRYSTDGGAVTLATLSATPLTPVARDPADQVFIGTNNSTAGTTPLGLAYFALWGSALSDGNLVTLSSSPSAGAPVLPSPPAWEWAAAAFAGSEAVTIDGTVHYTLGSPQIWTP